MDITYKQKGFYPYMLDRLPIITPFNKSIARCRWLTVKELNINKELERFNCKRSEAFISDSSCTKRVYVSGNNSFGFNLIALCNTKII